jgi:co-chaperonin GroES (HSP10)
MKAVGNRLFVDYDMTHNKVFKINGLELLRPDIYLFKDGESDNKMEAKVNKLDLNPQIATVELDNPKFNLFKGDKVFLHYMAYEWLDMNEYQLIDDKKLYCIDAKNVFFKILEDKLELKEDLFLGEVILENKLTLSGIHINVENKRKISLIKITHVPSKCIKGYDCIKVGSTVKTIDDNQYIINYNQKKYVVLRSEEIVGILTD